MIVICKFCGGSGRCDQSDLAYFLAGQRPCPGCGGAGELVLLGPAENYVICKVCEGTGAIAAPLNFPLGGRNLCSACKGAGSLARPTIQSSGEAPVAAVHGPLPRPKTFDFDVALSFAGEDKETVEAYSQILKTKGLRVFLYSSQQAELWGADLYVKLDEVYRTRAMFCVMFISKHYATQLWTNHERKSAQARAFRENKEYILPVRLDDTEIPGLRETVGYIDFRSTSVEELAKITLQKIEKEKERISSSNTG